jgi:cytochrome c oxidase subunit 1/cytochrome c oxidase subunit I+III
LWEDRLEDNDRQQRSEVNRGLALDQGRESLGTTALDAELDVILKMPKDSYTPVILALTLTTILTGLVLHLWWLAIVGALATGIDIIAWLWPDATLGETAEPARG